MTTMPFSAREYLPVLAQALRDDDASGAVLEESTVRAGLP